MFCSPFPPTREFTTLVRFGFGFGFGHTAGTRGCWILVGLSLGGWSRCGSSVEFCPSRRVDARPAIVDSSITKSVFLVYCGAWELCFSPPRWLHWTRTVVWCCSTGGVTRVILAGFRQRQLERVLITFWDRTVQNTVKFAVVEQVRSKL